MPTVHLAQFLLALEKSSPEWQVILAPQPDSRWLTASEGYVWDYVLQPPREGRDFVELRVPPKVVDAAYGEFLVAARHTIDGKEYPPWSPAPDGTLCSPPFASGAEVYVGVTATPVDPELPLKVPAAAQARGGGHIHVKTGGGGDPPRGGPQ